MAAACASAQAADQTITFPTDPAAGAYTPANVTIDPGDTVTFNGEFANHPLAWNGGEFATTNMGTSATFTLTAPGLHRFHCTIHASMVGSVMVGSGGGAPGDQLATPDFTWSPTTPQAGASVTFTAGGFSDPDGSIVRYEWDLDGNGTFETTGQTVTHRYDTPGSVSAALRYVDDAGQTSSATTHAFTVVRGADGGSGGTGGAPLQPGAPGSPSSPAGGTQGAGPSDAVTTAPRLSVAARALAFRDNKARLTVKAPAARTLTVTLKRAGKTLATGHATTTRAGSKTITLKLTRVGMSALRRAHGPVRATLTVVARARTGAKATTVRKTLSVSRRR